MAERPGIAKIWEEEMDSVELPAPAGWKKFVPKNSGIPKRNDVLFISPTGAEIRNRKQLTLFLRSHPGGPSPSEFDWKHGGTLRQSARINEKKQVTETAVEGPKSHKRKSNSNDRRNKHQKNGRDTQKEEKDEVPGSEKTATQVEEKDEVPESEKTATQVEEKDEVLESEKTATQVEEKDEVPESEKAATQVVVEGIVDAEMKDAADDSFIKEKVEPAAEPIENEIEVKIEDHDSAESLEGKNINEPEKKLQPEDSNKDVPIIFAPEKYSAVSENQEKLEVEEVDKVIPVLNANKESKNENSYVSELKEKQGVEEGSNEAPVFSIPEVTLDEKVVVRENRINSKVSPCDAESSKEVLREIEVKDRAFLNDGHKWGQNTVSSS